MRRWGRAGLGTPTRTVVLAVREGLESFALEGHGRDLGRIRAAVAAAAAAATAAPAAAASTAATAAVLAAHLLWRKRQERGCVRRRDAKNGYNF